MQDEVTAALLHVCYDQGLFFGGLFPARKGAVYLVKIIFYTFAQRRNRL